MKLEEAFAKKTYGGKGVPYELTDAQQQKINTNFLKAMEEQMLAHFYAMWDDMRGIDDMIDAEYQEDFPAYMKMILTNKDQYSAEAGGGYAEIIDSWLDYRQTDVAQKIAQIAKDRFK